MAATVVRSVARSGRPLTGVLRVPRGAAGRPAASYGDRMRSFRALRTIAPVTAAPLMLATAGLVHPRHLTAATAYSAEAEAPLI